MIIKYSTLYFIDSLDSDISNLGHGENEPPHKTNST